MIKKILQSPILMLILILEYAALLALATLLEKWFGADAAEQLIYHNIALITLQAIMAVNGLAIMHHRGIFSIKRVGTLVFHCGFVVILCGALTTHIWGIEGVMKIREGESVDYFIESESGERHTLNFSVKLNDFVIERYVGSTSPSAYQSHIEVIKGNRESRHIVQMNRVANIDGYRLFQTSFDKDERGTTLTVNYDYPGMQITYFGYILLLIGIATTLFERNSRFQQLNRKLKSLAAVALITVAAPYNLLAAPNAPRVVAKEQAKAFGELLVQSSKGRIEPMNSWSSKIIRKVSGKSNFNDLSSDQMLLNIVVYAKEWVQEPIIKVKNSDLQQKIGISSKYACYNDLFDAEGRYKLQDILDHTYRVDPSQRDKLSKDALSLDEVVNILYQLQRGGMLPILPAIEQDNAAWLSPIDQSAETHAATTTAMSDIRQYFSALNKCDYQQSRNSLQKIKEYQERWNRHPVNPTRIKAEILYNRLDLFSAIIKYYLICGLHLLAFTILSLVAKRKGLKLGLKLFIISTALVFLAHTSALALRWYISGHGPWSNSYETMVFVAWSIMLIGFTQRKKSSLVMPLTTLLTAVFLFVASLNWLNPEITPLVPILQSYWLMLHVAVIMLSYGLYFISAMLGATNLVLYSLVTQKNYAQLSETIEKSTIINELLMTIGTYLLCIGIFLGAVWANVSWGRYWGWDPKETWALITMMLYSGALHMRFVPRLNNKHLFNACSIWLILAVLMTYFGVNYYLTGLHSYGSSDVPLLSLPLLAGFGFLLLLTITSRYGYSRLQSYKNTNTD